MKANKPTDLLRGRFDALEVSTQHKGDWAKASNGERKEDIQATLTGA